MIWIVPSLVPLSLLLAAWLLWGKVSLSTVKLILFMVLSSPAIVLGFVARTLTMGFDFGKRLAMGLYK